MGSVPAVPGSRRAVLEIGNIGDVVDQFALGYNYPGYYTTINFIGNTVTILFGCWAGMLLRADKPHAYKMKVLAGSVVAGFVLGLALEPFNPMVKRIWTASFTFFSVGWVVLGLLVFYWLIDVNQLRHWA